jgi:N-6 DNA Methylase
MRLSDERLSEIVGELSIKPGHDKVKAAIQDLLVDGLGAERRHVTFEQRVPEAQGRIDAILGRTAFEVKSDLVRELGDAEGQLSRYLPEREKTTNSRFVGIATDGLDWRAYEWRSGELVLLRTFRVEAARPERLLAWLDGAAAIRAELPTDALTLTDELGPESVAFRRAEADLKELWAKLGNKASILLKRRLWQQLLRLVYGRDIENELLWLQHTYLVIVAKAIAARVLGFEVDDPADLLSGRRFAAMGVGGAVEGDFFDWVLEDAKGRDLIVRLARHVARFRLHDVEIDVLKLLYEALIDRDERHGLGEYYTPDWLAAKMVRRAIDKPLSQRVLDPACGSGTFLFHAVRHHLVAASKAKTDEQRRAETACALVAGMDIHPVAVIIARVTYLLALGEALTTRRGDISIPVYVGDAMQLSVSSMFAGRELIIQVPGAGNGSDREMLRFPETVCRDPHLLDTVVERMRLSSEKGHRPQSFTAAVKALGVADTDLNEVTETYRRYDALRRADRNTIWAYVARNLSRPLYLSADERRADVVVGNPPWLAFRYMFDDLQKRFRELAQGENIYVGGKLATQNDLSGLFFARSVALYLKEGGRIAFVMPLAAMSRGQFEAFRTGSFYTKKVQFDDAWVLGDDVQPLFPVPSCVLFAQADRGLGRGLPDKVRRYAGTLPYRDAPEAVADDCLQVTEGAPRPDEASYEEGSPYRKAFRQGATLVPRMLCLVERVKRGRIGGNPRVPLVASRRSTQEKKPWNRLTGIEQAVEAQFVRPVLLGESILPFRVFRTFEGVVPVDDKGSMLDASAADRRGKTGLAGWMTQAERLWKEHGVSDMTLIERWNYHNELGAEFPIAAIRIVYSKAGTLPAAAIVEDARTVIDHKLYWTAVTNRKEGLYLATILGSETTRMKVETLQSRGQWGARDFDKVMFTLPIPRFDPKNQLHKDLAAVGGEAEKAAAKVELADDTHFQTARRCVREALAKAGVSQKINELVTTLLRVNAKPSLKK